MSRRKGVMLAEPVSEKKLQGMEETIFLQPKLDGERSRVHWFHDEPVLLSSEENEFLFLDHLKEELKRIYKIHGPVPFDGELYLHGLSRQKIHSIVSRKTNRHPDVESIQYHIFDVANTHLQMDRMHFLLQLFEREGVKNSKSLCRVETTVVSKHPTKWMPYALDWIEQGYEGAMLRHPYASYRPKRTNVLLKFKPTEKDQYEIVAIEEAISQHGQPKGMIGAFFVTSDEGTQFSVSAGKLNHQERISLWKNRSHLIGRLLNVKQGIIKTDDGKPTCAVALSVEGVC